MRLKSIENWEYKNEFNCMLYFAQLLEELLFNYTLDSYKTPALNTNTLCDESLAIISEINREVINKGALNSVIEELEYNLKNDIVSEKICGVQTAHYIKKIKNTADLQSVSSTLLLIKQAFEKNKFLNTTIEELKTRIIANKEKENIQKLARIYVTELINKGYDKNYIYNEVNQFFFSERKINAIEQLEDFFGLFDFSKKKYKIIFFVTRLFNEIKEASISMGIVVEDSIDETDLHPTIKAYINNVKSNKLFVTIESEAFDYYSAFLIAEKKIEKVACLFNFFHHKNRLVWKPKFLVVNQESKENLLLTKPDSSILNCKDLRPKLASKDLKNTIKNFTLVNDSFRRVDKSLDLHSYALNTDTLENQLINLWTSFETLIPKKENINKDRIIQLTDVVIPFQSIDYIKKHIQYIQKSVLDWSYPLYKHICKTIIEGEDTLEKFGAFISLEKYQTLRDEIITKLIEDKFLILANRIFVLNKSLSSIESTQNMIKAHNNRILWHLQRIYRTRNLIVHSGLLFSFASVLIENIHSYYDLTVKQIFKLAIDEKKIKTLEQAFVETEVRLNYHLEFLEKNKSNKTDASNFKTVLFGINI